MGEKGLPVIAKAPGFTTRTKKETAPPASTSQLTLTAPSTATHGIAFNLTVTAKDTYGNITPGYTGTIHLTSSDSAAALPANYTFLASDNGVHTFSVTLNTVGAQTVAATDTLNSQINGVTGTITVN